MKPPNAVRSLSGALLAALLVVVCIAIGVVGLVLPIIPGLLFLAIAVLIVARHVPWVDARLRRHRFLGRHLDSVDGFARLSLRHKLALAVWLSVRTLLDGLSSLRSLIHDTR